MISMHWSVRPAILAGASLCVSNRPQKRSKLVVLCAVLVVMLCGAGSIASAQTAYFSGAQTTLGSGFNLPAGVAVDGSGNVYVADAGNNAVKEILAAGGYTRVNTLGSGFSKPNGVAVDGSGNVYVADAGNNAVKEILAAGGYATINTLGSGFNDPSGIAVDGSGNVYVADAGNNAVKEILAAGGYATINTLGSGFNDPSGVAVDGHGNLFVADADNNLAEELALSGGNFGPVNIGTTSPAIPMVFTFDTGGTLGSTAVLMQGASGQDFADAGGDSCTAGTSYNAGEACTVNVTFTPQFAGTRYGAVVLRNSNGNPIATGYVHGTGVGPQVSFLPGAQLTVDSFVNPWGAAVDGNGNLYVADNGNLSNLPSGVYKETLTGGSYVKSAIGSGFHTANGVAVDGAGNVYVADQGLLGAGAAYEGPGGVYLETLQGDGSYVQTAIGSGWELPSYVAVDGSGNVYVTDDLGWDGQGIVIKLTLSNGAYTQATIGQGYNEPFGVAVDGSGNVYFADYAGGAVYELALSNGSYKQSTVASGFNEPYGLAVDGIGDVYVTVNAQNYWGFTTGPSYVIKETLQPNGTYTQSTVFTGSDFLPDVAVDGSGSLYLADATSNEVYKEDDAYPPSPSFASTAVGSTSSDSPQTVQVFNLGNEALNISSVIYPTDFPEGAGGANACTDSTSLNAGEECDLPIDFTPRSGGLLSENITLTDNTLNVAGAQQSVVATGRGIGIPTITWNHPSTIIWPTPLSGIQLNATANVAGTFVYSPPAGTVLNPGKNQTLSVTFTPTDTVNYTTATATQIITVTQQAPVITWATPAPIVYGTLVSAAMQNATANVPGTFSYSPAIGTLLTAAPHIMYAAFTPTDTIHYGNGLAEVTLTVTQATQTLTFAQPTSPVVYGVNPIPLSCTSTSNQPIGFQLVSGPGEFSGRTLIPTGVGIIEVECIQPATNNYAAATPVIQYVTVKQGTPAITWANPAAITYGTALSGTQLDAKAANIVGINVPGTFTYSPAAGTVLTAGSHTLSVTFTPTDTIDYATVTASATITVNQATPVITWATPAAITYGTTLSATQLNATATWTVGGTNTTVAGTFTYTPAAGQVLTAGPQTLSVTFTPTDTTDYATPAAKTVKLTVNQVTPVITWATPASVPYGTALSATQLDATATSTVGGTNATVAGTFTYTPAAGTVMTTIGSNTLKTTFAPTDTTDYATPAAKTITLTVNQATPVITWATPAPIVYGTLVSAAMQNATANVPGTFSYSPAIGTLLTAAQHTMYATFTPTDTIHYGNGLAEVTLTVTQAPQTLTFAQPTSPVVYGVNPISLSCTSTSNQPISFQIVSGPGKFSGHTLIPTGVGTIEVECIQPATNNYAAATPVIQYVTVNQAAND